MNDGIVGTLVKQLSDRSGRVREKARNTLVLIGEAAVPSLLDLAGTRDKRTRWEVAKTLAAIADPASIPAQVRLLSDAESDIRWVAATGLIKLGPRVLPSVLQAVIDDPNSISLRRSVHHVLHDLAGENPVVEELVGPVMEVLGDTSPAGTIPPAADQALTRIQAMHRGILLD